MYVELLMRVSVKGYGERFMVAFTFRAVCIYFSNFGRSRDLDIPTGTNVFSLVTGHAVDANNIDTPTH